jgi:hypothetical protein
MNGDITNDRHSFGLMLNLDIDERGSHGSIGVFHFMNRFQLVGPIEMMKMSSSRRAKGGVQVSGSTLTVNEDIRRPAAKTSK